MPLWGRNDADANTAPKHTVVAGSDTTCVEAFGNVTVGAIKDDQAIGVFGVDTTEAGLAKMVSHAGWVVVRQGTGPVASLTVVSGGTGYANADTITVSGGVTNATGTLVTNSTGGIVSASLTSGGSGFLGNTGSLAITTSGGSGANVTFTLGGRAGRTHSETLVAIGTITGDTDDSIFPDS